MSRRGERGFSLVETVLALGLLAGVLISIAGLFVLGGRQVKSGRTASEALSVGRGILEEMDGWGFTSTFTAYGFDGTGTSYSADTRTNTFAQKWQTNLQTKLGAGSFATIDLTSLSSGTPPTMSACKAIRVEVTVNWEEGLRHRSVRLGTVRM